MLMLCLLASVCLLYAHERKWLEEEKTSLTASNEKHAIYIS